MKKTPSKQVMLNYQIQCTEGDITQSAQKVAMGFKSFDYLESDTEINIQLRIYPVSFLIDDEFSMV